MRDDRDGLLDALVATKGKLYAAQTLLLDCFALFDDVDHDHRIDLAMAGRVTGLLTALGFFLETVPWEKDPHSAQEELSA